MREKYALREMDDRVGGLHGEIWWLYLGTGAAQVPHFAGEPLEEGKERGWYRLPSYALFDPASSSIELVGKPRKSCKHYERTRAIEDGNYPLILTIEEYDQRTDDDDEFGDYDPLVRPLYVAVYEEGVREIETVDGPWVVLDGSPPPKDGMSWVANLPNALRYAPEYRHLFPGCFEGFREAVRDAIGSINAAKAYVSSGRPGVEVYVEVDILKPEPARWEAPPRYDGLSAADRRKRAAAAAATTTLVTRRLLLPAPSRIEGATRAEAVDLWYETLGQFVSYVGAMVASPCPTCNGHGWIEPPPIPEGCTGYIDFDHGRPHLAHDDATCPVCEG